MGGGGPKTGLFFRSGYPLRPQVPLPVSAPAATGRSLHDDEHHTAGRGEGGCCLGLQQQRQHTEHWQQQDAKPFNCVCSCKGPTC